MKKNQATSSTMETITAATSSSSSNSTEQKKSDVVEQDPSRKIVSETSKNAAVSAQVSTTTTTTTSSIESAQNNNNDGSSIGDHPPLTFLKKTSSAAEKQLEKAKVGLKNLGSKLTVKSGRAKHEKDHKSEKNEKLPGDSDGSNNDDSGDMTTTKVIYGVDVSATSNISGVESYGFDTHDGPSVFHNMENFGCQSVDGNIVGHASTTSGTSGLHTAFDKLFLSDTHIFWAVIISILVIQFWENWDDIIHNHFTFGTVAGLMLLSFAIGLEMDDEEVLFELKTRLLGIHDPTEQQESTTMTMTSSSSVEFIPASSLLPSPSKGKSGIPKMKPFFKRIFNKKPVKFRKHEFTSLARGKKGRHSTTQREHDALNNAEFRKRLSRFSSDSHKLRTLLSFGSPRQSENKEPSESPHASNKQLRKQDSQVSTATAKSDIAMGETRLGETQALHLLQNVAEPLCELRGIDLFSTEDPDPEILTHPFLIK
jgi:hypothetical protein